MKKTVTTLVCIIVFTSLVFQHVVSADATWDIQVVDENTAGTGNGYCPISVDSNNNPHIAYTGRNGVMYVYWNGSEWNTQQISHGGATDLALDANGNPHILYETGVHGGLVYARWTGTEWTSQTITENHVTYASLTLDSFGNPHVAYRTMDSNDEALMIYSRMIESEWSFQTVDAESDIHYDKFSLSLDANNNPYIMYFSPSSYVDSITSKEFSSVNIKFAVLKNSGWKIEPVLASANLSDCGKMVLDSEGYPHFLCAQRDHITTGESVWRKTIMYASWDGSVWNTQTVASDVSLANIGFLALDSDDCPHIVYITRDYQLIYSCWTGTTWDWQTVDDYRLTDKPCYLAIDSNDKPHITYLTNPPDSGLPSRTLYLKCAISDAVATIPDASPLNVSIISPANQTYSTTEVSLTFAASKNSSNVYYSLDGEANVTVTANITLTNLPNGTHNLTIYAEDINQNTPVSETVYFTVKKEDSTILLVSAAVIIILAITVVYVWKKKH